MLLREYDGEANSRTKPIFVIVAQTRILAVQQKKGKSGEFWHAVGLSENQCHHLVCFGCFFLSGQYDS